MLYAILFLIQITILYLITKKITAEIFFILRKIVKNEKFVLTIVSLIYFPGTLLHEVSHMLTAMILALKVNKIKIFPVYESGRIQLGSVEFEKKDFVRGFLVGIAPVFTGITFLYSIFVLRLFPSENIIQNIFFIYLIFSVSSTMFSSRQDLIDFIYFIPLILILALLFYILQVDINIIIKNEKVTSNMLEFFKEINLYIFFGLIINLIFLIILKTINHIFRK